MNNLKAKFEALTQETRRNFKCGEATNELPSEKKIIRVVKEFGLKSGGTIKINGWAIDDG